MILKQKKIFLNFFFRTELCLQFFSKFLDLNFSVRKKVHFLVGLSDRRFFFLPKNETLGPPKLKRCHTCPSPPPPLGRPTLGDYEGGGGAKSYSAPPQ